MARKQNYKTSLRVPAQFSIFQHPTSTKSRSQATDSKLSQSNYQIHSNLQYNCIITNMLSPPPRVPRTVILSVTFAFFILQIAAIATMPKTPHTTRSSSKQALDQFHVKESNPHNVRHSSTWRSKSLTSTRTLEGRYRTAYIVARAKGIRWAGERIYTLHGDLTIPGSHPHSSDQRTVQGSVADARDTIPGTGTRSRGFVRFMMGCW